MTQGLSEERERERARIREKRSAAKLRSMASEIKADELEIMKFQGGAQAANVVGMLEKQSDSMAKL